MGKLTKNPNGTYSMEGFSTENKEDMEELKANFFPFKDAKEIPPRE